MLVIVIIIEFILIVVIIIFYCFTFFNNVTIWGVKRSGFSVAVENVGKDVCL